MGGPAAHLLLAARQSSRVPASGVRFGATPGHFSSEEATGISSEFPHSSGAQISIPAAWGFEEATAHVQPRGYWHDESCWRLSVTGGGCFRERTCWSTVTQENLVWVNVWTESGLARPHKWMDPLYYCLQNLNGPNLFQTNYERGCYTGFNEI